MHDFVGSPGFFAPEMLRHANYSARKVDLWSLGCVVLELLLGHGQFDKVWMDSYAHRALQDVALFDRLLSSAVETVRNTTRWPSPELRAIEMRLLQPDEELRISLDDLCAHPWLQIAPSERAAAAAAQPKPASTDDGARKLAEAAASSAAAAPLSTSRRGRPLRSTQSRRPGQEATGRRTRQRRTLQRESPFVAFPASQPHHHHRPSLVPTRRRPALRESPCLRKRRHLPCAWVPCAWDLLPCRSIRSTTALFSCRPCQARGQIPGDERPAALPRA